MKGLNRFFSLPVLISELIGLILLTTSAYSVHLLANKQALIAHLEDRAFPRQIADIEVICGNCFVELWSFLTIAYIVTIIVSISIACAKKHRANRLYINVLVLAISWVPLVRSPIEEYLFQKAYSLLTFASIDHLDVNLILISVLFLASVMITKLINF